MKILANLFILATTLFGAQAFAYTLDGQVTSLSSAKYPNNNTICYIAIEDPNNSYYSNKTHAVNDSSLCGLARTAFFLGVSVIADAKVDNYNPQYANDIVAITIKDKELLPSR